MRRIPLWLALGLVVVACGSSDDAETPNVGGSSLAGSGTAAAGASGRSGGGAGGRRCTGGAPSTCSVCNVTFVPQPKDMVCDADGNWSCGKAGASCAPPMGGGGGASGSSGAAAGAAGAGAGAAGGAGAGGGTGGGPAEVCNQGTKPTCGPCQIATCFQPQWVCQADPSCGGSGGGGMSGSSGQGGGAAGSGGGPSGSIWVTAYYAAWMTDRLPVSAIDFGAITHLAHFSIGPTDVGGIDTQINGDVAGQIASVVSTTHAAGKKVLITVGGAGTSFTSAASDAHRADFVASLVSFVTSNGYDGLDVDWEPIDDPNAYATLITDLRTALDSATPGLLLTSPVPDGAAIPASARDALDQLNIMTYDMAGPWDGWVTWYNSPVYDGSATFPSTGGPIPCIDSMVDAATQAGAPVAKLGVGIDFYSYVWSGATAPLQSISGVTVKDVAYFDIVGTYLAQGTTTYDPNVIGTYLSIDSPKQFIPFEDETVLKAKIGYVKQKGLGGVIIWELGGGYLPDATNGPKDPLLQAIKSAL